MMPVVREPHFCQPPAWPWMYRLNTVWQCRRCKTNFRVERTRPYMFSSQGRKRWVELT